MLKRECEDMKKPKRQIFTVVLLLTLVAVCCFAVQTPLAFAQIGDGVEFGDGFGDNIHLTSSPPPISTPINTSAQVMATFLVIVVIFAGIGIAAKASKEADQGQSMKDSFFSVQSIIGYVLGIAVVLIIAGIIAGWGL